MAKSHNLEIVYKPLIRVEGVSLKEFRAQKVDILAHSAVVFTSRTTIDSFFHICETSRITIPETMKYICQTEAVALYLQKYIVYRKRKISFADGTFNNFIEMIVKQKDEKLLLAMSEPHKPELPDALDALGLNNTQAILARTVAADMDGIDCADFDMIALYSPSDVAALISKFDIDKLPTIVVFGRATLAAAIEAGLKVKSMAPTPAAPSMAKAVDLYINKIEGGESVADLELVADDKKEEFLRSQQCKLTKKGRATARTNVK
ncbi:MAG: uroporphyrinogen-III synthase [Rikenellaceae bacterium]